MPDKETTDGNRMFEPANPVFFLLDDESNEYVDANARQAGLTVQEDTAIRLRVPESGNAIIDAMIRRANKRDVATRMVAALLENRDMDDETSRAVSKSVGIGRAIGVALLAMLDKPGGE